MRLSEALREERVAAVERALIEVFAPMSSMPLDLQLVHERALQMVVAIDALAAHDHAETIALIGAPTLTAIYHDGENGTGVWLDAATRTVVFVDRDGSRTGMSGSAAMALGAALAAAGRLVGSGTQ